MKKFIRFVSVLLFVVAAAPIIFSACDDDTASIGFDVMPGGDGVSTSQSTYVVHSVALAVDSVLSNTNDSYLGCVVDPETRAKTTCSFLAQFHVLESYSFPPYDKMVKDENGKIVVDSCDLRIAVESYYGDSLTTMKLVVQELDTTKVVEENKFYYSNVSPEEFYTQGQGQKESVTYAVKDLTRPDSVTDGYSYYRSVIVKLPRDYGDFLVGKFYENPDNYANSYQFIHHVCPGFYFKTAGGVGSMLKAKTTTLNVYFRYHTKNASGNDTIVDGMQRMAATEEVIQQTVIDNAIPQSMLAADNPYTYVKSPSGIFTEVTLPVSEVVAGEHYTDTINTATLSFLCYNKENTSAASLSRPETLLMVRKKHLYSFFEAEKLTNESDSYLTTFNSSANAYTFTNISGLLTLLKNEREARAGVLPDDTESERSVKYAIWEKTNPEWNKVVLVPVKAEYSTTTNAYGQTTKTLLRVRHDMSMSSAKIAGGTSNDIKMNVIYSRFARQ